VCTAYKYTIKPTDSTRFLRNRSLAACTQPARIFPSQPQPVAAPFCCFRLVLYCATQLLAAESDVSEEPGCRVCHKELQTISLVVRSASSAPETSVSFSVSSLFRKFYSLQEKPPRILRSAGLSLCVNQKSSSVCLKAAVL